VVFLPAALDEFEMFGVLGEAQIKRNLAGLFSITMSALVQGRLAQCQL